MKIASLLFAFLAFSGGQIFAAESPARPNIIFVLADDMGLGDLGCYGGSIAPTPNLDRLAREGTRFTRYYSASPICSPSRCGLITGQFPARWNITSYLQTRAGNRQCEQADFLDAKAPSLPRVLKEAGYATAHIGKWHLGGGRDVTNAPKFAAYGYDMGLSTYESPEPHPSLTATNWVWSPRDPVKRWDRTAWMVDQSLAFVKKNPSQPCFVNLWLDDPHTPWVVENGPVTNRQSRANLVKVLTELDWQIGRLMDGVPTNTLLIFATDNGALPTFNGARNTGLRGSKLSLYEGGTRLPFITRWPGRVPAARVDESSVLAAVDLLPTFASLTGAKLPANYAGDGEDVSAALLGKSFTRTKPIFWEYGRNEKSFAYPRPPDRSPNLALRDGPWKLLVNADGTGAELYDLLADPHETKNLADVQPERAGKMKAALLQWRRSLPSLPTSP